MKEQILVGNSRLTRLVLRLRPDLLGLDDIAFARGYQYVFLSLYLFPLALLALVWLFLWTDWTTAGWDAPVLLILLVAVLVMNRQTFSIIFNLGGGKGVNFISSLSSLALWSGILIAGPNFLWLSLLAALINRLYAGWQLRRYNQDPLWEPLSLLVQDVMVDIFAPLVGLVVYLALGGVFPLTTASLATWGAAFAAMAVAAMLPGLILLPGMLVITRTVVGQGSSSWGMGQFFVQVMALSLIVSPFAVLVALVLAKGGLGAFGLFVVGIILVNALANYMSRTAERSRQRTRELERLEDLSEALLQAPPDGRSLPAVLEEYLPRMFPGGYDLMEVRLLAADGRAPWRIQHPLHTPPAPEADWAALQAAPEAYLVRRNVLLPDMRAAYGHAVFVKIPEIGSAPGRERPSGLGGVYLLRHRRFADTLDSLPAVQALANQIGSALYRARVYQETLAHQKVAQELAFAGRIQASFLPRTTPAAPGWDLAATLVPARETSGDFYDFMALADGRIGLLVADVADKGTGAALYMALSRTLIRTYALDYPDEPGRALQLANERILSDTESDQFVTLFYGVLDPATGTLTYSNAGHNPAFLLDPRGESEARPLGQTGIPLGMFPGMAWRQEVVTLAPGDLLVMYTDGVSEAQDVAGAEFGETRLLTAVQSSGREGAKAVETAVLTAVQTFVGDAPQFDDITLLIVKRLGVAVSPNP